MDSRFRRCTNYVRNNFDEMAILAAFVSIANDSNVGPLSRDESFVLSAIRRSSNRFSDASIEEIGEMLREYDPSQMPGLVNNVKGILFELEFVEIENSNGDSIFAYQFEETNYPAYDIQLIDQETGQIEEIQLKATDSASYVQSWMDEHGDNIVVTDEVAERMGLQGVGVSNDELEVRVEDFVAKLQELDDRTLEYVLGSLGAISLALSLILVFRQYMNNQISKDQFLFLSAQIAGRRIAKYSLIAVALSLPGLNFLTAVGLAMNLIIRGKHALEQV